MFVIKEPSHLDTPWVLSRSNKEPRVEIPTSVTKFLKNYQILPVEFLYHNLRKGRTGAVLNQDDGMDFPLQIAAFFRAVLKMHSLVLVLCPDYLIADWHYNLSVHGDCDVIIVQNCKNLESKLNINGRNQALVLGLTELKLADNLIDLDLFSVVVQNFDEVANKRILRNLKGDFNIGLSNRSFYKHPDQKLQWTMLDWANPGCVGKLKDFYEYDSRNFAKYLDNYRIWWQRLTWSFCESFKEPTEAESKTLQQQLKAWAKQHNLTASPEVKPRTRKSLTIIRASPEDEPKQRKSLPVIPVSTEVKSKKRKSLTVIRAEPPPSKIPKTDETAQPIDAQPSTLKSTAIVLDESSSDTVEYEPKYVELPSMDEHPILSSIIKNFEVTPESVRAPSLYIQPSCSNTSVILSQLVEIPAAEPSTTACSEDFLIDLVTSSAKERNFQQERNFQPTDLNVEIDRFLAETDGLLDD